VKFLVTGFAGCIDSMMIAHPSRLCRELSILTPLLKGYCEVIPHDLHFIEGPAPAHC
jgi:hypothetical protein